MTSNTREKYEAWYVSRFEHCPMKEDSAPAFDFCWAGYKAGAASRDAEVDNLAALGSSYLNRANTAESELDWVRNILASHGYDGPLGDGCCPLSEWLSERDDLGESLAQVKVKNQVLIQQLETARIALQKLSYLGNGDQPGNSTGNRIAQHAMLEIWASQ